MTNVATTIKSTALDFNNIKNNLKTDLAGSTEFADYNFEGSALSNLLDVLANNTHYNALIANMALNESYLSTAQLRSSLVSLAEGIGYIPKSKTASFATVNLSLNTGNLANRPSTLSISKGTKFTASVDDITYTFQTTSTSTATDNGYGLYQFKDANDSSNIIVKEGVEKTKTFFVGEDAVNSIYVIPDKNLDINTAVVKVFDNAGSTRYATYINLIDATTISADTRLFILKETPNGFFELSFGDNVTLGRSPVAGNKITVEYLSTSGPDANNANAFTAVNQIPVLGTNFTLNATLVNKSTGGSEKEQIESIRKNAPFSYAAQNRMVTSADYSTLVTRNYGNLIKDIQSYGGEDALNPEFGVVFLSIEFNDDITDNTVLQTKNSILDLTKQLSVVGFDVKFEDPSKTFIETEVYFQFNPKLTSKTVNIIQDEVQAVVQKYFTDNIGKFNQSFRRSNMLSLVDEVDAAVLSSRAEVKMQKRIIPFEGTTEDFKIRFPAEIADADEKIHTVTSSSFVYQGQTAVIRNKLGSTKLQIIALNNNTVVVDNIGSYSPGASTINIIGLNIQSIIGGEDYIQIKAKPANESAISPLRNDILNYDSDPSFTSGVIVSTT